MAEVEISSWKKLVLLRQLKTSHNWVVIMNVQSQGCNQNGRLELTYWIYLHGMLKQKRVALECGHCLLLVIGKTILYLPWSLYHIIMIITIGYMWGPGKWLLLIIGYWQHPISRTIHAAQRKTCNKLETCLRESRKTNLAKAHIIMIFLFLRISSRGRTSAGTLHLNNRMSSIGYSLDMAYSEYTRF